MIKYGESRTSLSRQVSSNVVGILEDAVQMGEMMQSGQSGFGGPGGRGGLGMALGGLNADLALTEEQKEKGAKILAEYQKRLTRRDQRRGGSPQEGSHFADATHTRQ